MILEMFGSSKSLITKLKLNNNVLMTAFLTSSIKLYVISKTKIKPFLHKLGIYSSI